MGRDLVWHKLGSARNRIVLYIMPGNSASVTARLAVVSRLFAGMMASHRDRSLHEALPHSFY
jgi:hypothetical protein